MASELGIMEEFLYGALTVDTGLAALVGDRIYVGLAVQGAATPYVVYHLQAASPDTMVVGGRRIQASALYTVRGVSKGHGYSVAEQIANRIDAVLHGQRGSASGGVVVSCHREMPLKLPPELGQGGAVYWQQGGIYRLRALIGHVAEEPGEPEDPEPDE